MIIDHLRTRFIKKYTLSTQTEGAFFSKYIFNSNKTAFFFQAYIVDSNEIVRLK